MRTIVLPLTFDVALKETLDEAQKAYRQLSRIAFQENITARYALQKRAYHEVRITTKLTAQMTCSAIRRVASAYRSMRSNGHEPKEPAKFSGRCIDLEGGSRGRDFRLYPQKAIVSVSTVAGRKKVSYRCGAFQRRYLESLEWKVRAAKLIHKRRKNGWRYELHVSLVRMFVPAKEDSGGILGVDIGRRYLAVATTGEDAHFFPAGHLKARKEHFRRLRGTLKSKGTRSSIRTYDRVSGREARLTKDFQHKTAKVLVELAREKKCSTIVVEKLNGIRERTATRGKKGRYHHATWAYRQFLEILHYKARGAGLELVEVDPSCTSRACSRCGCVDKRNRKGLSFQCFRCGYCLHADLNASRNIRLRAILQRQALLEDGPCSSCGPEVGFDEAKTTPIGSRIAAENHGKLSALADST